MTPPDLLATLDAAAEDLAHARRAVAAAGRTDDPAARLALLDEARVAVRSIGERVCVAQIELFALAGSGVPR